MLKKKLSGSARAREAWASSDTGIVADVVWGVEILGVVCAWEGNNIYDFEGRCETEELLLFTKWYVCSFN
jgi:hypothetical protein